MGRALPLGNGRIGAMIFGGVEQERIQVNEESIWYGGPVDMKQSNAKAHLEEIRQHIFEGRLKEAQRLMNLTMSGCPTVCIPTRHWAISIFIVVESKMWRIIKEALT